MVNLNFEVNESGIKLLTESNDPKSTSELEYRSLPFDRSALDRAVGVVG